MSQVIKAIPNCEINSLGKVKSLSREVFKDIPNYEGLYQISNLGRVKSLKALRERILKGGKSGRYRTVLLCKNGVTETATIHSMVAKTFIDADYLAKKLVVDHIDNNPLNNNLDNLQIITCRLNNTKDKKPISGFTGAYPTISSDGTTRYRSTLVFNKESIYLGTFDTPNKLVMHIKINSKK